MKPTKRSVVNTRSILIRLLLMVTSERFLERDKDHDLEYHEILLDNYFTVYYWEGKVADI